MVAAVAAYASYVHQRDFALQGGADETSATLWPLSVDGLLLLATMGLLSPSRHAARRTRGAMWLAFLLGIAVSLAANIAAAPTLDWRSVLVAGWPPVALLLSVELLVPRRTGGQSAGDDVPEEDHLRGRGVEEFPEIEARQVPPPPAEALPASATRPVSLSGPAVPRAARGGGPDSRSEGPVAAAGEGPAAPPAGQQLRMKGGHRLRQSRPPSLGGELLDRARREDARHRQECQRPISAETLRKRLGVGAKKSRALVEAVRREAADAEKARSEREFDSRPAGDSVPVRGHGPGAGRRNAS
ncbi:DUF2637 domain-containing protein [Streptomyces sp. DSM 44917]|uniref:DUF2637 domain-containing protein n=1 Tax=Streptomyces boetiae TaxID=3075541 RepID=A0ABU2LFV2_9ACTN|nr:DUF2637 domain-containing protein [Streptomyces sp. DSM 44917]MDT0310465.1 DUF2637 domain-containing protein [Streptomyces sp. DSM 44917]